MTTATKRTNNNTASVVATMGTGSNRTRSRGGKQPTRSVAIAATCTAALVSGGMLLFRKGPTAINAMAFSSSNDASTTLTSLMQNANKIRAKRFCPCCGWSGDVMETADFRITDQKDDCMCPRCKAMERHRRACTFIAQHPERLTVPTYSRKTFRLVHFGPQKQMEKMLNLPAVDQVGLDLCEHPYPCYGNVMKADITSLPLPNNFGDGVIILHVLEHIPDLDKAFDELHRVTKKEAWMLVEVPYFAGTGNSTTNDCRGLKTDEERLECAGQKDHVWGFGMEDFERQLRTHGWDCRNVYQELQSNLPGHLFSAFRLKRLDLEDPQYFCTKTTPPPEK